MNRSSKRQRWLGLVATLFFLIAAGVTWFTWQDSTGRWPWQHDEGALALPSAAFAGEDADTFRPLQVVAPFDPITDAPFLDADAVRDQVSNNELVLGVVIGDEARAYPINMLRGPQREIINDTVGNRAIAATW